MPMPGKGKAGRPARPRPLRASWYSHEKRLWRLVGNSRKPYIFFKKYNRLFYGTRGVAALPASPGQLGGPGLKPWPPS